MHLSMILFLVAMAGVTALPVLKMGLDPQPVVEGRFEVREPQVSPWFRSFSFSLKLLYRLMYPFEKYILKSCLSLSDAGVF